MEKFMYLFRGGDAEAVEPSPEAIQAHLQAWLDWISRLGKAGQLVSGEQLLPSGKTVAGLHKVITDLPYSGNQETINGYLVVQTRDLHEAIEVSKDCPIFRYSGQVEVRPVLSPG